MTAYLNGKKVCPTRTVNNGERYLIEASDPSLLPSWYRVYSDGWVEQGGYLTYLADYPNYITDFEVALLKEFNNTNYYINVLSRYPYDTNAHGWQQVSIAPIDNTSFNIACYEGQWDTNFWFYWEAKGFIDLEEAE